MRCQTVPRSRLHLEFGEVFQREPANDDAGWGDFPDFTAGKRRPVHSLPARRIIIKRNKKHAKEGRRGKGGGGGVWTASERSLWTRSAALNYVAVRASAWYRPIRCAKFLKGPLYSSRLYVCIAVRCTGRRVTFVFTAREKSEISLYSSPYI